MENNEAFVASGWELDDFVPGVAMDARYRITADDVVVEVRRNPQCVDRVTFPGCPRDHDHLVEVL